MFNSVPTVDGIMKQFATMKDKLQHVIDFHTLQAEAKNLEIKIHDAEVAAASKAKKALEAFI